MSVQGEKGNLVLTDDIILRELMKELKSSCVAVKRVHRDLESRFASIGDTISILEPNQTLTSEGRTLVKQPMAEKKIPFQITRQRNFGIEFTQRDKTLSIQDFSKRFLMSGARQLGNDIELSVLQAMLKKTYNASGTPGTALTSDNITDININMTLRGVPEDGARSGILNGKDGGAIDKEMKGKYNEVLVKDAIQKGYMGPLADIEMYRSAMMPVHTVGDYGGTPLINGAGQTGASLVTDGWTASKTALLNEGDTFTISGVYEVHPQTRQSTGTLQSFRVTSVAASNSSGQSTISISPSINNGGLTATNAAGQTVSLAAYQNVTNAPADNAVITVRGTANTAYRQNVFFHMNAFTLCMVNKELPETAPVKARLSDPDTGLSLSMTAQYDINEDSQIYRVDAVWGVDALQPQLAERHYSSVG